ncbi:MAG TPA: hypothetical protein VFA74_20475 [Terriglobales bacterium]|nr:hypothetical protein [Terriglobales bacterium]
MVRLLLTDVLGAAALVGLWFFLFARYNRQKGAAALKLVETACLDKGQVINSLWLGNCRLQVNLSFAAHWFGNARVTVRLLPRPIPVQWLLSLWRKQKETVTFEADLDDSPSFHLEIFRHRWLTHNNKKNRMFETAQNWEISRPGPVVLTTRTGWTQELTPVVNTLMTSRGHNLITVRFRPQSPQLTATIPLDSFSDEQTAASFLSVVRELATGASTSRQ